MLELTMTGMDTNSERLHERQLIDQSTDTLDVIMAGMTTQLALTSITTYKRSIFSFAWSNHNRGAHTMC